MPRNHAFLLLKATRLKKSPPLPRGHFALEIKQKSFHQGRSLSFRGLGRQAVPAASQKIPKGSKRHIQVVI
jgi:hypothetical protein